MHSVAVRIALYVLSPILATVASAMVGYGVTYDEARAVVSIEVPTLVGAIAAASGISALIFKQWGVK